MCITHYFKCINQKEQQLCPLISYWHSQPDAPWAILGIQLFYKYEYDDFSYLVTLARHWHNSINSIIELLLMTTT